MGLSWRHNTRKGGNKSWLNFSASSRGLHASASVKPSKNTTLNFGKHGTRATINLGNGLRWTGYGKHKKSTTTVQESQGPDFFDQCLGYRKFHPIETLSMLTLFIGAIIGMAIGGKDGGAMGLMGMVLIIAQLSLNQLARIPILGMLFGVGCAFISAITCFVAVLTIILSVFKFLPTLGSILMIVLLFPLIVVASWFSK